MFERFDEQRNIGGFYHLQKWVLQKQSNPLLESFFF